MPIVDRSAERIADLERELAEALKTQITTIKLAPMDSPETLFEENGHLQIKITDLEGQLAAMSPMVEACKARYERHLPGRIIGYDDPCPCLTCQWYRDYEARKPK